MSDAQPSAAENADRWTVRRILDWTTAHLEKHGSETPRLDAEILLAHARKCPRVQLYTRYNEELTDAERAAMRDLVKRRANREPVAYLVGHREFFSLKFRVTPDVLVPRPDTETLVVELIDREKSLPSPAILDIGTGSGCIAIAAAVNLPRATITAIDLSEAALKVAAQNAEHHQVGNRISFLHGDLFAPIPKDARFDLIVSNPPYITIGEYNTLQDDVRLHEPKSALVAGADGLDVIRRLITESPPFLKPGGSLLIEIAPEQAVAVERLMRDSGTFTEVAVLKDLSRQARAVCGTKATS